MNPNTRGAANSLYRSTGRGSQRKAMQEWALCITKDLYSMETQDGLPSQMYENKKPCMIKECEQVSGVDQNFLKQKRANSAFEFFMRQRQGVSEDIPEGMIETAEIQGERSEFIDMAEVTVSTYPRYQ